MPKSTPSIRDIAAAMGLSKATVANALNASTTVAESTRRDVEATAQRMGYRRNPMVGAFMSALRRSRGSDFQGVLAAVERLEPERRPHGPFHVALIEGCKIAAIELGFTLETFELCKPGISQQRLNSILRARGIRGVIILPTWSTPDFTPFDWTFLTGIYADYIPERPVLNTVCCDHYRSVLEMLERLHVRGYRRPGFFLETHRDERVHHRVLAALRTYQTLHPECLPVAPLVLPKLKQKAFATWLRQQKPDVVLSHDTNDIDWILACGKKIPEDIGYVALNAAKIQRPCAALDLHPERIGRVAVEALIGQIQRQAWGLPRFPANTTIIGEFREGPTLRNPAP